MSNPFIEAIVGLARGSRGRQPGVRRYRRFVRLRERIVAVSMVPLIPAMIATWNGQIIHAAACAVLVALVSCLSWGLSDEYERTRVQDWKRAGMFLINVVNILYMCYIVFRAAIVYW
jgi:hypothetical protein